MPTEQMAEVRFIVNGQQRTVNIPVRRTLADALRMDLGLTGTHLGCEHGVCGACTVLLDGQPIRSCLMFGVQVDGMEVTTVEGLASAQDLNPLQEAFRRHHALQCGYCTPGILMGMLAFVQERQSPSEAEVRRVLSGYLCRCTGYQNIVSAVLDAAVRMSSHEG